MSELQRSVGQPGAPSRPIVVCICGMLASGKSALAQALAEHWRPAPVLAFDDYEQYALWPTDILKWVRDGADPSLVSNPRLRDDLDALVKGQPVQQPLTHADLVPSPLVLLEDPFGRTRPDIRDLINFVLFIDLPADLSVVRLVRRTLALPRTSPQTMDDSTHFAAEAVRKTNRWLDHYVAHREMYTAPHLLDPVRGSSDVILDGERPQEHVVAEAISHISQWLETSDSGPSA